MKNITKILSIFLLSSAAAHAHSPSLNSTPALVLAAAIADVFDPNGAGKTLNAAFDNACAGNSKDETIVVKADAIDCRVSNVGVGMMTCSIDGSEIKGRAAYEMFLILDQAGSLGDAGAGSSYMTARDVVCTVDMKAIGECAGSGANCTMKAMGH